MSATSTIILKVRDAVADGRLGEPFRVTNVYHACGGPFSTWASFLAMHAVGNPSGDLELFVRVGRGLYRLKTEADR